MLIDKYNTLKVARTLKKKGAEAPLFLLD
jgi:hypothetical protein